MKKEYKKEAKKEVKKGKDGKAKDVLEIDYDSLNPNKNIPQRIIILEGADEFLNTRLEGIPEEKKANTHYNPEDLTRRLTEYKARHDEAQGGIPMQSFFEKRQIEILNQNTEAPEEETAKIILEFIEKVSY